MIIVKPEVMKAIAEDPVWLKRLQDEVNSIADLEVFLEEFSAAKGFKIIDLDEVAS